MSNRFNVGSQVIGFNDKSITFFTNPEQNGLPEFSIQAKQKITFKLSRVKYTEKFHGVDRLGFKYTRYTWGTDETYYTNFDGTRREVKLTIQIWELAGYQGRIPYFSMDYWQANSHLNMLSCDAPYWEIEELQKHLEKMAWDTVEFYHSL